MREGIQDRLLISGIRLDGGMYGGFISLMHPNSYTGSHWRVQMLTQNYYNYIINLRIVKDGSYSYVFGSVHDNTKLTFEFGIIRVIVN